ncbi:hypothetical protein ACWERI_26200 [Streptomyces collinus]
MRVLSRRVVLAAPAAVPMWALVACGGSDSGSGSKAADTQQQAQSADGAEAASGTSP